jgi:hypothetical protein
MASDYLETYANLLEGRPTSSLPRILSPPLLITDPIEPELPSAASTYRPQPN